MDLSIGNINKPFTVSQFFQNLKQIIERSHPSFIYIIGSVTEFRKQKSKQNFEYITFTLQEVSSTSLTGKDQFSSIRCYWPSNNYKGNKEFPDNRSEVIVKGKPELSSFGNTIDLTIFDLKLTGESRFLQKYNSLKKKLIDAGLYGRPNRQPILFPKRLAVIASVGSHGLQDLLKTLMPSQVPIEIIDIPMGGPTVDKELTIALKKVPNSVDLCIIARGGGIENEDLLRFSSISVAQAIAETPSPVWTALGHTRDRFLIDEVADNCMPNNNKRINFAAPSDAGQAVTRWIKEAQICLFMTYDDILQDIEIRLNNFLNLVDTIIVGILQDLQRQLQKYHEKLEDRELYGQQLIKDIQTSVLLAEEREVAKKGKQKAILIAVIIIISLLSIIIWMLLNN